MRQHTLHLLLIVLFSVTAYPSFAQKDTPSVKIAITKTNDHYSALVERNSDHARWVNLYGMRIDSAIDMLRQCDGLLVTGGEDVYPGIYRKLSDTARCEGFDRYRDSLELAAIDNAIEMNMPVFGICRGLQIINVALGGTLIIDIPGDFGTVVRHRSDTPYKCYHQVNIVPNTLLAKLSGIKSDTVNSAHHQGIEKLGKGLIITAYAADSLPEAIEWKDKGDKGFLMATQWHPERLDPDHPLSKSPAAEFLREASEFHKNTKKR